MSIWNRHHIRLVAIVAAAVPAIMATPALAANCPTGTSITLTNSPCVKSFYSANEVALSINQPVPTTVTGSLAIPSGKYLLQAQVTLSNAQDNSSGFFSGLPTQVWCRLEARTGTGTLVDYSRVVTAFPPTSVLDNSIRLEITQTMVLDVVMPSSGRASVLCSGKTQLFGSDTRIEALKLGTLIQNYP